MVPFLLTFVTTKFWWNQPPGFHLLCLIASFLEVSRERIVAVKTMESVLIILELGSIFERAVLV